MTTEKVTSVVTEMVTELVTEVETVTDIVTNVVTEMVTEEIMVPGTVEDLKKESKPEVNFHIFLQYSQYQNSKVTFLHFFTKVTFHTFHKIIFFTKFTISKSHFQKIVNCFAAILLGNNCDDFDSQNSQKSKNRIPQKAQRLDDEGQYVLISSSNLESGEFKDFPKEPLEGDEEETTMVTDAVQLMVDDIEGNFVNTHIVI